jgi:hypothetical protein
MDYFPREQHALLAYFCRRVVRLRVLAKEFTDFEPEWLRTDERVERWDRLGKLAERETRMMIALARSLRITNQSRYQASTAARRRNTSTRVRWHRGRSIGPPTIRSCRSGVSSDRPPQVKDKSPWPLCPD